MKPLIISEICRAKTDESNFKVEKVIPEEEMVNPLFIRMTKSIRILKHES